MQRLPRYVPHRATRRVHPSGLPVESLRTHTRARTVALSRPLASPWSRPAVLTAVLLVLALLLAGCGASEVPPSASITEPAQNATFNVGDSITIKGKAAGTALKAVDLYVNSTLLARSNQPVADNEFEMQVNWTPDINGPVILVIKGVNDKDEAIISSDPVFITIAGDAAAPAAEPTLALPTSDPAALPTAAAQPTADPNQPAPTTDPALGATVSTTVSISDSATTNPAATTAPAATSAPAAGGTTLSPIGDFSNVRKGPGLGYDIVGTLAAGQSATVKGRNADSTWYQINFAAGENGTGWIFGEVVTVTGNTSSLPVGEAPPLPTAAPVTAAPPAAEVPVVPINPVATAAPTAAVPPAAALPYDQGPGLLFEPDNGLDYNALAVGGQTTAVWSIKGATSAQIEIVGATPPDIYDCPAGNTSAVSVQGRQTLTLPEGRFPFSISAQGYYVVTIYVAKADGSNTTIPRGIVVACYKKPGR